MQGDRAADAHSRRGRQGRQQAVHPRLPGLPPRAQVVHQDHQRNVHQDPGGNDEGQKGRDGRRGEVPDRLSGRWKLLTLESTGLVNIGISCVVDKHVKPLRQLAG